MLAIRNAGPSIVRSLTPVVVAYLIGFPVVRALGLDDAHMTALVTSVLTGLYYLLVRALETWVTPRAGWLLGYASTPSYGPPAAKAGDGGQVAINVLAYLCAVVLALGLLAALVAGPHPASSSSVPGPTRSPRLGIEMGADR